MTLPALLLAGALLQHTTITLSDDLARTLTLPAPARRVVSLAPSITETLWALGAGDQVVGVTDYCNFPPGARTTRRVGGIINPSIETIVSLRPDLIILSMEGNMRGDFQALTGLGIPVFVTNPRTLGGIARSMDDLGLLTGHADSATALSRSLLARAEAIQKRSSPLPVTTVLLFVSLQPLIVAGSGTFVDQIIRWAGGANLAAPLSSTYPSISREAVVSMNPDVMLFLSDVIPDTVQPSSVYPEWKTTGAFRRGRVIRIDADIISRPGPRAVNALESLFTILHPSAAKP